MMKAVRQKNQKRFADAGGELDRRAKLVMGKKSVSYREALSQVMKKSPKLAREYHKSRKAEPPKDLRVLCESLEQETALAPILRRILCPRAYNKGEVAAAADTLADMMGRLQTSFYPIERGKSFAFAISFPRSPVGLLARAIQDGTFRKLKCCGYEECQGFFISEDHRIDYHSDCFKKKEAWRAKLNRAKA